MNEFDVAVIGNGMFGSAAARHLSELGSSVVLIGPDEPADHARHQGVFASHYDQGRLTRLQDRNSTWAPVTRRAVDNYAALERVSGIRFHYPVGVLIAARPNSHDERHMDPLTMVRQAGIEHDLYEPGDKSWQANFPQLAFPSSHYVVHEPAPAGFINPRRLIQAQNRVAIDLGGTVIREIVAAVRSESDGAVITTAAGATYQVGKVLVAAGAFSNFNGLLAEAAPLKLKTEVIVLARVSLATVHALERMPTVKYMTDQPELDGIYMVPPMQYPDGNFYIKIGANTTADQFPTTLEAVQAWFRHGDSDYCLAPYQSALGSMLPDTDFLSFETKRCVVSYTPTDLPLIQQVDDSVFVAAGGNGGGAKGSDAWGELAAGLVHDGRWPAEIPRF